MRKLFGYPLRLAFIGLLFVTVIQGCFTSDNNEEVEDAVSGEGNGDSEEEDMNGFDQVEQGGDFSGLDDDENFSDSNLQESNGENNFGAEQQFETDGQQQLGAFENDQGEVLSEQNNLDGGLDQANENQNYGDGFVDDLANQSSNLVSPDGSAASDPNRVVRYIMRDNVAAYPDQNSSSNPVASYMAGTPLVVLIQGEWAEVAQGYFIPIADLSEEAVPRSRTAEAWK